MASERKRVLFVCHDFCAENLPLQPWRYIHELASGLVKHGFSIFLLTNGDADRESEMQAGGYKILKIDGLSPGNRKKLKECISPLDVDHIVWSLTPSSIAYWPLFKALQVPIWGLFNYPIYRWNELASALKHVPFRYLKQYYRNWLIPSLLISAFLNSNCFNGIFCQSLRNINRLNRLGVRKKKLHHLPPGLDHDVWKVQREIEDNLYFTFVYAGSIKEIRGIRLLIDAFSIAKKKNQDMRLRILARGASEAEANWVKERCRTRGCEREVDVLAGWLEHEPLKREIRESHAVILPFILVPSEMPLAVLEAMSMGKPVIGTDLDGIPEMIGDRGIVVKAGDMNSLAEAMLFLSANESSYEKMRSNCMTHMQNYPGWDQTVKNLDTILNAHQSWDEK